MARSDREILRLLNLLAFLNQRQGEKAEKVAAELGMSRKQLMAELERISLYGLPPFGPDDLFMATIDEAGCLDIAYTEQFRLPLHLTAQEAMALRTAVMPLWDKTNPSLAQLASGVLTKLDQALLPQDRLYLDRLSRSMVSQAGDDREADILELLRQARNLKQSVEMTYFTAASEHLSQRRVDPYGFVFFGGAWYMVGYCQASKERRVFKVSRIRELKLAREGYSIPDDFDITEYSGSEIFRPRGTEKRIKIWFSPQVARWILERSRQARRQRDGSATLEIQANSFAWIARWVLQYGPEARILEPPEARAELARILKRRKRV